MSDWIGKRMNKCKLDHAGPTWIATLFSRVFLDRFLLDQKRLWHRSNDKKLQIQELEDSGLSPSLYFGHLAKLL